MKYAATVDGQLGTANAKTQRLGRQRQWRAMAFMLIAWFILTFAGSIMLAPQLSKQNIDAITVFVGTGGFLGAMFLWVGLKTGVPMFDNMRIPDGREAQLVEMLNHVVPKLKHATAPGREKGEALSLLPELDTLVAELDRLINIYGISGTPQQVPVAAKTSDDMRDV
nr:hypothetical protein [Beijerinckiaceae bacterium]